MSRITTIAIAIFATLSFSTVASARRPASDSPQNRVWTQLGSFQDTHLKAWKDALAAGESDSASDVLDAFNELAYTVTGPAGFWRKTLPTQWLGCAANADTDACVALAAAGPDLAKWDAFQAKISTLGSERAAARFLKKNEKRIATYIATYVPVRFSASDIRETGFFKTKLATALAQL